MKNNKTIAKPLYRLRIGQTSGQTEKSNRFVKCVWSSRISGEKAWKPMENGCGLLKIERKHRARQISFIKSRYDFDTLGMATCFSSMDFS